MAVKPKDDKDAFLREVDEELRREQIGTFVERYGKWLIGGFVLLLAAIGGAIWWSNRSTEQAGEAAQKLSQVIEQVEGNNFRAAAPVIDELAGESAAGYRYGALFTRANAQIAAGNIPEAINTLRGVAQDQNAPAPYRDAAVIRQTQLELDGMRAAQVIDRLRPYAVTGSPWFGSAGEMIGVALMRQQRYEEAGRVFAALARDASVPDTIRNRARQMASSLGQEAPDPSIAEPPPVSQIPVTVTPPAPPAAAPAPATTAPQNQGNGAATRGNSQ